MGGGKGIFGKIRTTNEFFNASFVYILANGIGQGTTLLANIFFTRYMSQSDYGLYSNYYSYVAILVPFAGMNLYVGLANAYMDYREEIRKVRSSLLMLSLVGFAVTAGAMSMIKAAFGLTMPWMCVLLAVAHAYAFYLVNHYAMSMNMENRFAAKGLMLAVPNVLQALFAGIALAICNTYVSRAAGSTIGVLSCGIIAAAIIVKECRPAINKEYWLYALKISLPAIVGSVAAMIMQQCDKVMITSMRGAEETAVYALIYYIGYILYAVQQATNGAWQAWIYKTLDEGKYGNIPDVQKWYMFFMLVLATGLYMLAPEIIKILSPENYWHFGYVVPFIIGSYLMLMYSMNLSVTQYEKKTGVNSLIVAAAAAINIFLNYLMIGKFGGVGAAYTSVVSYAFIHIVSGLYLRANGEYPFKDGYYLVSLLIVVLLGVVFYGVKDAVAARYGVYAAALAVEGIYALAKREEIRKLFGGRVIQNG